MTSSSWRFRAALLVPPVLVYLSSLGGAFQYDDFHSIVNNPHVRSLANIPAFFADPTLFSADSGSAMFRPLLLTTLALNYAVSGYQVWSYHVVNILLHAATTFVLGSIGVRLLGHRGAAVTAALLFGLHPVNAEAVNYISSRSELMCGFFVLVGLWAFLERERLAYGRVLVVVALAGSLLSKSVGIVLPGIVGVFAAREWLDAAPGPRRGRDVALFAGLLAISGAYLFMVRRFIHTAMAGAPVRPFAEHLWTQLKALVFYLDLLIWPSTLSVDHQFLLSIRWRDPLVLGAVLLLLSLALVIGRGGRERRLRAACLSCALMALAPASLVPLNVLVNEHRLYLASAFLALVMGSVVRPLLAATSMRGRVAVVATGLVLTLLGSSTWQRNYMWRDPLSLWQDAAAKAPLMARPYLLLGQAYADAGEWARARDALQWAITRDSTFVPAYVKLAAVQQELGELTAAERSLRQGIVRDATSVELWGALGGVMRAGQRWRECRAAYARAVQLAPGDAGLLNNLGNACQMVGDVRAAETAHRRALAQDADNADSWLNLGNALLMGGRPAEAAQAYQRAAELDDQYAAAWSSLGNARERLQQWAQARTAYRRAVALGGAQAAFARRRLRQMGERGHE